MTRIHQLREKQGGVLSDEWWYHNIQKNATSLHCGSSWRTFARLVRTNKLKTGNPSLPGFVAAIICSRMAIISCCLAYCDRICGGTLALPFFMVQQSTDRACGRGSTAVDGRPVISTVPPNDDTLLPVIHADPGMTSSARRMDIRSMITFLCLYSSLSLSLYCSIVLEPRSVCRLFWLQCIFLHLQSGKHLLFPHDLRQWRFHAYSAFGRPHSAGLKKVKQLKC